MTSLKSHPYDKDTGCYMIPAAVVEKVEAKLDNARAALSSAESVRIRLSECHEKAEADCAVLRSKTLEIVANWHPRSLDASVKDHAVTALYKIKEAALSTTAGQDLLDASPDDIRAKGWSVACHNDYRQTGQRFTFWLFTKDGHAVKGEGFTDAEALNDVRTALKEGSNDC